MQWEKHPYFTLSSLTHWKVLIWFIIMKLNSRYLFLGLKHFTGAFNEINGGNKHVNIEIKCCHVEHTAHWWDSTFSLSHYRLSSFWAHHTSVTIWRLWNLMQDEKKKIQLYSPRKKWLWFRDPATVDVQEERVRVRKQHRAVEGSQTGPLEDGTWGILAICLSFVVSYKVRAPFIMLRQRGAWLWQRIWATGEKGGISEVSLLAAFKQGQPLHWLWHN